MLEGKLALAHVTRVGLPQDGMAKPGNNLSAVECLPDELCELLLGHILSELLAETIEPYQHLLYMHIHTHSHSVVN